jgi:hypothetical protein
VLKAEVAVTVVVLVVGYVEVYVLRIDVFVLVLVLVIGYVEV